MLYTMKQTCKQVEMNYETLKFYCNEGLVPLVKRDAHNYRVFDERDIAWIKSLSCLKKCGMSITEMKDYVSLCLKGKDSIPARQLMLDEKKILLQEQMKQIQESLAYIDIKQQFYQDVLANKVPYKSNIIDTDDA